MTSIAKWLGVLIALAIIGGGLWLMSVFVELSLDYPTRLAGQSQLYPDPPGTWGYYKSCASAIMFSLWGFIYPFGIAMLAATYCLWDLVGGSLNCYRVSRLWGLVIGLLSANTLLATIFWNPSSLIRWESSIWSAWPAIAIIFNPKLWPYALIIMSCWIGCLLTAMSIYSPSGSAWSTPGVALTALNVITLYRHGR